MDAFPTPCMELIMSLLKLALGIPVMGDVHAEAYPTHLALAAEMGKHGELVISTAVDLAPHDRARNKVMNEVISAGSEFLMFVDADTGVPVGAFEKLWETLIATKGVIATAHCYRRGYPFTSSWSKKMDPPGGVYQVDVDTKATRPVEIDGCGFPCTLLDLNWVRDNMDQPWFLIESDGRMRTKWEDWHFCQRVRSMGGQIYGDPRVRCDHWAFRVRISDDNVQMLRKEFIEENMSNGERC